MYSRDLQINSGDDYSYGSGTQIVFNNAAVPDLSLYGSLAGYLSLLITNDRDSAESYETDKLTITDVHAFYVELSSEFTSQLSVGRPYRFAVIGITHEGNQTIATGKIAVLAGFEPDPLFTEDFSYDDGTLTEGDWLAIDGTDPIIVHNEFATLGENNTKGNKISLATMGLDIKKPWSLRMRVRRVSVSGSDLVTVLDLGLGDVMAMEFATEAGDVSCDQISSVSISTGASSEAFNVAFETNRWNLVELTYDGSVMSLFLNGAPDAILEVSPSNFSGATDDFVLQGSSEGVGSRFDVDTIVVYQAPKFRLVSVESPPPLEP